MRRSIMRARVGAGLLALCLGAAVAAPSFAAPVDSGTAKSQLFSDRGGDVQIFDAPFLSPDVVKAIKQEAAKWEYYAAIAVSPGEPASSNLMVFLANFHSPQGVQKAVLDQCNARRTTGKPCVVVALTTPKKYKPRAFTLSAEATKAFKKSYRKLKSPKAMAVSPGTGFFAMDRGDGGRALASCNVLAGKRGVQDCVLAVAD